MTAVLNEIIHVYNVFTIDNYDFTAINIIDVDQIFVCIILTFNVKSAWTLKDSLGLQRKIGFSKDSLRIKVGY